MMTLRHCKDCDQDKPLGDFYKKQNGWVYTYCKACHGIRNKLSAKNPKREWWVPKAALHDDWLTPPIEGAEKTALHLREVRKYRAR